MYDCILHSHDDDDDDVSIDVDYVVMTCCCEMWLRGKSVHSRCDGSSDRSFMVDPLSYFSFQPVFHDWCNKAVVFVILSV